MRRIIIALIAGASAIASAAAAQLNADQAQPVTAHDARTIERLAAAGRSPNDGGPTDGAAGGQGVVGKLLAKPFQDLADFIDSNFDEAIEMSTAIPGLPDGNGQACWVAMKDFGVLMKKYPLPISGKLAPDIQRMRLLIMAANRLCATSACTQVFQDGANLAGSISPVPLVIPSLASICGKIPAIAVVPPSSVKMPFTVTPSSDDKPR